MRWFNEFVQDQLEKSGMNKADLARKTGYSYAYINDLTLGKKRWNEETMMAACKAFDCKIEMVAQQDV